MLENQIGTEHALFYQAKAVVHENKGNFSAAAATFEAGLRRRAQPLGKVEQGKRDFERRMVRRMQKLERPVAEPRDENGAERVAFQRISTKSAGSSHRPTRRRGMTGGSKKPSGNPFLQHAAKAAKLPTPHPTNFKIFADNGPAQAESATSRSDGQWTEMATHAHRHKENSGEATTWTGCPIAQKASKSSHTYESTSGFAIFDDNVDVEVLAGQRVVEGGLRNRLDRQGEDPPSEQSGCRAITQHPVSPTVNTVTTLGEVLEMFGGDMISRAHANEKKDTTTTATAGGDAGIAAGATGFAIFCDSQPKPADEEISRRLGNTASSSSPETAGVAEQEERVGDEPTMTIQTRAAHKEVFSMFSSPPARTIDHQVKPADYSRSTGI